MTPRPATGWCSRRLARTPGSTLRGRDAVARIGHERDILQRLDRDSTWSRRLHDYFTLGEHHFLVQEFVDAQPAAARSWYGDIR